MGRSVPDITSEYRVNCNSGSVFLFLTEECGLFCKKALMPALMINLRFTLLIQANVNKVPKLVEV